MGRVGNNEDGEQQIQAQQYGLINNNITFDSKAPMQCQGANAGESSKTHEKRRLGKRKGVSLNGSQIKGRSVVRATSEGGGSSCCGGGGGSSGGSCSGSNKPNVAGVGAEFANMVAQSTMLEFEKEYEYGEMEGKITRDVVQDVVNEVPELLAESREEKFVDVEQILAEARSLAKGDDLIFDAELEELMV